MKISIQSEVLQIPSIVRVELSYGHKLSLFLFISFLKKNNAVFMQSSTALLRRLQSLSLPPVVNVPRCQSLSSSVGAMFTMKATIIEYFVIIRHYIKKIIVFI